MFKKKNLMLAWRLFTVFMMLVLPFNTSYSGVSFNYAQATAPVKITVCHELGNGSYQEVEVDKDGWDDHSSAHSSHEGDFAKEGEECIPPVNQDVPVEPVCGDGIVNQEAEQCDEGEDNGAGSCTDECIVVCPFGEEHDYIVTFTSNNDLRSNNSSYLASDPEDFELAPGTYSVTLFGYDSYLERASSTQSYEQFLVKLKNDTGTIGSTNKTTDLEDNIIYADTGEEVVNNSNFTIYSTSTYAIAYHGKAYNQSSANSITAVCAAFDLEEPLPDPVCGDGRLNQEGEQCDDGNDVNGDGCTATCEIEELTCEDLTTTEEQGWYGRYYNYFASHEDMNLSSKFWPDDGHGDPMGTWDTDWYDSEYFRFSRIDNDIEFGEPFFPFDIAPEEINEMHDYHFGVRWTGLVSVDSAGDYEYELTSDDDSWVYVDGVLVADNAGIHAPTTATGTVALSGSHIVDIFYAERHVNRAAFSFNWTSEEVTVTPYSEECPECGNGLVEDGEACDGTDGCTQYCQEEEEVICDPEIEIVLNGSFENPTITNSKKWDVFTSLQTSWDTVWASLLPGTYGSQTRPATATLELHLDSIFSGSTTDGRQYAELDGDWGGPSDSGNGEPASVNISQIFNTLPGYEYEVSFDFSPRPGSNANSADNNILKFLWNGILEDTISRAGGSAYDWSSHSYTLVAEDETAKIEFEDAGTPSNSMGTLLDNVSVRCVGPAPYCGDGEVNQESEECDGSAPEGYECTSQCILEEIDTSSPYCGDGEVNQSWEQCDGEEGCTSQCQNEEQNECSDLVLAKVRVDNYSNTGNGNVTSDIYLGSNSNVIPAGTWFALYHNGSYFTDPDIASYQDVPGLAVQRLEDTDSVRLVLHGSQTNSDVEHVDGAIEFYNATVTKLRSDKSTATGKSNQLENGFNGTKGNASNDEVEITNSSTHSEFWLTTTTADDGYYSDWSIIEDCSTGICGYKYYDRDENGSYSEDDWILYNWTIKLSQIVACEEEGEEWADSVIEFNQGKNSLGQDVVAERSDATNALGEAQYTDAINFVALGFGGELILGFDNLIVNQAGNDVEIVETTYGNNSCAQYREEADIFASQNGIDWVEIGSSCQDGSFDLGELAWAQFIKIVDTTSPSEFTNRLGDGFDVDGVRAINCASSIEVIETTKTDRTGYYCFEDVAEGSYRISEVQQNGWKTTDSEFYDIEITEGEHVGVDFFNTHAVPAAQAQISGFKYWEKDDVEGFTEGDEGLGSWEIWAQNGETVRTTNTAEDGSYEFNSLFSGTWTVWEVMQSSWKSLTGATTTVELLSNLDSAFGVNFGNVKTACSDGIDNDEDGGADIDDAGCHTDNDPNNEESYNPDDDDESDEPAACSDGLDNDEDELIDENDPNCHTDGDPENEESYDPDDDNEAAACSDGLDNDEDEYIDSEDPGCHSDNNPENQESYDPDDDDESDNLVVCTDADDDGFFVEGGECGPSDCDDSDAGRTTDCGSGGGGGGGGGGGFTSLIIHTEKATGVRNGDFITATITWHTNKPANSRVVYDTSSVVSPGLAPNYGYAFSTGTFDNDPKVTFHTVVIENLLPNTKYYFRPLSAASPEIYGIELEFTTDDLPETPEEPGTPTSTPPTTPPTGGPTGGGTPTGGNPTGGQTPTSTEETGEVLGATNEEETPTSTEETGEVLGVEFAEDLGVDAEDCAAYLWVLIILNLIAISYAASKSKHAKKSKKNLWWLVAILAIVPTILGYAQCWLVVWLLITLILAVALIVNLNKKEEKEPQA